MEKKLGIVGSVITVVNGRPYKFFVTYEELGADSQDLTNSIPIAYRFAETEPRTSESSVYYVRVSEEVLGAGEEDINKALHERVIRFALASIREDPSENVILFTSKDDESVTRQPELPPKELKVEILRFMKQVNDEWPTEKISFEDLLDNLNGSKEHVSDWIKHYREKGYLIEDGSKPLKAGGTTTAFRVNPKSLKEIEQEIGRVSIANGKLKVFLSYSHKDKHVAGKVKTELEERGLDVFLAHDDIEVSEEWKERILEELKSCHVFIPILSGKFKASDWADQETGHAFANQKVIVPLNLTCNPYGFIGKYQAKPLDENVVSDSCRAIVEALSKRPELASVFNKGSDN